ncbi:MAG: hypothetical protein GXY15_13470 [Candidatus Hydrogenedentes bacterium]|nr:hypothetical protein [Candidatus Hydrogenedentota bacterium]
MRTGGSFSAAVSAVLLLAAVCAAEEPYTPELLTDPGRWGGRPEEALVSVADGGLRVEVSPGRTWSAAVASDLVLPAGTGRARVRVSGCGAEAWFVRLYGDLRGTGGPTTLELFRGRTGPEEKVLDIDERCLIPYSRYPVQIQLGVEGPPGSWATFSSLEFLPRVPRSNVHPLRRIGDMWWDRIQLESMVVRQMPNLPEPFKMRDWRETARAFDRLAFDFSATGEHLPLIWLDESRVNTDATTFGLYSYVGDTRQGPKKGGQEAVTCIAAVVGASLVGIDKRGPTHDYVRMCEAWQNTKNGLGLVLNTFEQETGGSFWYELWPQMLFAMLADKYPGHGALDDIMRRGADRWLEAVEKLSGPDGVPDFNHTAFNFRTGTPVDNGKWREPDAAAGAAWLLLTAGSRFQDERYYRGAAACLRFLEGHGKNPYYEVLAPYGALAAARMEAERGEYFRTNLVESCFGISDCRGGWGVTVGNWGGYDCDGLVGSIDNNGGYAFTMNSFAQAAALVPLVRYNEHYARAVGKWMLNLANAARLFYPDALPADHQTSAFWKGDPGAVIAYEGLRREWQGKSPCATGDPLALKWGPQTDLGLYGSSYVGFLGAIVSRTDDEHILQLDCLATDFHRGPAYPTFLYYNPHDTDTEITVDVGPAPCDLYYANQNQFGPEGVSGKVRITIPADDALVVVFTPDRGVRYREKGKLLVDGVLVEGVGMEYIYSDSWGVTPPGL